ncbi:hypothetical protein WAK64_03060 [Bacillus spongiae]|uniref:Uncharacterized protein n=1 Tax=Bacillus spongiae TaxID=2683610 RepID=A0ABU8HA76_9BACI
MDLAQIWDEFMYHLNEKKGINQATWKKSAGIPFIYIHSSLDPILLDEEIKQSAANTMVGFRLHAETEFVRKQGDLSVYRHRFFVPQEKMFCCGNLCEDCIRLKRK